VAAGQQVAGRGLNAVAWIDACACRMFRVGTLYDDTTSLL
jgi:hypothetical protein